MSLKFAPLLALATLASTADISLPSEAFSSLIAQKVLATANDSQNPPSYPQYTDREQGVWQFFTPDTWTSGFFPVTLYAMDTRTSLCPTDELKSTNWVQLAQTWSAAEVPLDTKTGVGHDVGFLSFPFAAELEIHPDNQTAVTAVNNFAKELAARFNPIVGCTRSWDTSDPTDFQVIIDNMMNLEVLFVSANLTGNHTLVDIATSHADKTMVNHLRPDGSSYHVVDYNATTGAVIKQHTAQGYADNSTWSRGQAWGIYGFANMFKHTRNVTYLETSRKMAQYFLSNIPSDGIVPWDFNAPLIPPRPADSSAAMIAASGFLLLSQGELGLQPANKSGSDFYINAAIQVVSNMTALAWRPEWQSLLANGTVNNPQLNNLTGIVYGDYYFVKTVNDLVSLGIADCNGTLTGTTPSEPSQSAQAPSGSKSSMANDPTKSPSSAVPLLRMDSSVSAIGVLTTAVALLSVLIL